MFVQAIISINLPTDNLFKIWDWSWWLSVLYSIHLGQLRFANFVQATYLEPWYNFIWQKSMNVCSSKWSDDVVKIYRSEKIWLTMCNLGSFQLLDIPDVVCTSQSDLGPNFTCYWFLFSLNQNIVRASKTTIVSYSNKLWKMDAMICDLLSWNLSYFYSLCYLVLIFNDIGY